MNTTNTNVNETTDTSVEMTTETHGPWHFRLDRKLFTSELEWCAKFRHKRRSIPILNGIRLRATWQTADRDPNYIGEGRICLFSTDLETSAQSQIEFMHVSTAGTMLSRSELLNISKTPWIDGAGKSVLSEIDIVFDPSPVIKFLKTVSDKDIVLVVSRTVTDGRKNGSTIDDTFGISFRELGTGGLNWQTMWFGTMDHQRFIDEKVIEVQESRVLVSRWDESVAKVSPFCDEKVSPFCNDTGTRYSTNQVCIEVENGKLARLVSTDGHRLSTTPILSAGSRDYGDAEKCPEANGDGDYIERICVPVSAIEESAKLAKKSTFLDGSLWFSVGYLNNRMIDANAKYAVFSANSRETERTIYTRVVDNFPDWRRSTRMQDVNQVIDFKVGDALTALSRVMVAFEKKETPRVLFTVSPTANGENHIMTLARSGSESGDDPKMPVFSVLPVQASSLKKYEREDDNTDLPPDPWVIINGTYVAEFLAIVQNQVGKKKSYEQPGDDNIRMRWSDAKRIVKFIHQAGDWEYWVMPMRP